MAGYIKSAATDPKELDKDHKLKQLVRYMVDKTWPSVRQYSKHHKHKQVLQYMEDKISTPYMRLQQTPPAQAGSAIHVEKCWPPIWQYNK